MRSWQIQEAKAHLSELVRDLERLGPQVITWHGREVAVVLSSTEYARLTGADRSLVDFIQSSPLFGADDIDLERDMSTTREIEL
jgi:prevent-host-death family protein